MVIYSLYVASALHYVFWSCHYVYIYVFDKTGNVTSVCEYSKDLTSINIESDAQWVASTDTALTWVGAGTAVNACSVHSM